MTWLTQNRHLVLALIWVGLMLPTLMWWSESILWVAFMSLYAIVETHLSAHHALRAQKEVETNGSP